MPVLFFITNQTFLRNERKINSLFQKEQNELFLKQRTYFSSIHKQ